MDYKNKTLSIDIIYDIISEANEKALILCNNSFEPTRTSAKIWLTRPDKFFFVDKLIARSEENFISNKIYSVREIILNIVESCVTDLFVFTKPYNNNKYTSLANFVEDNRDYAMRVTGCSCNVVAEMTDKIEDMGVCISSLTGYVYLP